ncbi:MAG: 23S rRNA (adenine(2503)-C(2))-methyltransferase RlmN [Ruminococcaceae bacterium]|nr:23S rRNA (adenine(2503)-C(2))-methyltransferase RlmN [Oscillospiraceae bacterium]
MKNILSYTPEELKALMGEIGEPAYRAGQIFSQLHKGISLDEMTNVGKATKEKLSRVVDVAFPGVRRKLVSRLDGTVKYLFELTDGNCIESVVMRYEHGYTICISSQVGCRMGCKFCASTLAGRVRDLEAGELLGQIIAAQRDLGIRISNVVMMGIGEPLDNFDNVVRFLKLVNLPEGINIGYRHISLSTCGVVPKIYELAKLDLPITLSISLHAPDDETRSAIMPVNNTWGVSELLDACRDYYRVTERRMSFEYTLISGKNDSVESAAHLARVLNSHLRSKSETMPIHVNLIPVNEVEESGFKSTGRDAVRRFAAELEKKGIRATIRRTLGSDINASCGQLRREETKGE